MILSCNHDFIDLVENSLSLSTHVLFGLPLDSYKILLKGLVVLIPFLPFKGTTHLCLQQISITHNKE